MISITDSDGFKLLIDVAEYDERGLIEKLVDVIRERDPDVLENHNIFGFDLMFLARRARALGVDLAFGRDGSAPSSYQDVVKVGEKTDSVQPLVDRRPRGRGHPPRRPALRRDRPRHAPPGAQGGRALLRRRQRGPRVRARPRDLGHLPEGPRARPPLRPGRRPGGGRALAAAPRDAVRAGPDGPEAVRADRHLGDRPGADRAAAGARLPDARPGAAERDVARRLVRRAGAPSCSPAASSATSSRRTSPRSTRT